jgi:hypothetical protein
LRGDSATKYQEGYSKLAESGSIILSTHTTTAELIEKARVNLDSGDEAALGNTIGELVINEPSRWWQLMVMNDLWLEPSPRISDSDKIYIAQRTVCLMGAMKHLLLADIDNFETVIEMFGKLQGALALQLYYLDIVKELTALEFTKSPTNVQLWRLLGYLEDVCHRTTKNAQHQAKALGYGDPYLLRSSSLQNPVDGSKISPTEHFDSLCGTVMVQREMEFPVCGVS